METSETAAAILDFFRTHDWLKGKLTMWKGDEVTGACLLGAEMQVNPFGHHLVTSAVGEIAMAEWPERVYSEDPWSQGGVAPFAGIAFNNHPDTTWADLEKCLEKVAAREAVVD